MIETPFPQADNLDKVLDFILTVSNKTKTEMLASLGLTASRQFNYYCSASIYLGFVEKKGNRYVLTKKGRRLVMSDSDVIKDLFLLDILKHPLINRVVINKEIDKSILNNQDSFRKLSESTRNRRSQTIESWLAWILNNLENEK